MHKLAFLNPVGLKSENFSTVRLGTKWAERTHPDDQADFAVVELVDGEGKSLGTAKVRGCWVGQLSQVPALLLECEHDPVARGWSGLAQSMAGIYPKEQIGYDTVITVLQLTYTGSAIQGATPEQTKLITG